MKKHCSYVPLCPFMYPTYCRRLKISSSATKLQRTKQQKPRNVLYAVCILLMIPRYFSTEVYLSWQMRFSKYKIYIRIMYVAVSTFSPPFSVHLPDTARDHNQVLFFITFYRERSKEKKPQWTTLHL